MSCRRSIETASGGPAVTTAAISPDDLRRRVEALTDDSTAGRETGSEGDYKAATMVANEFRRLGLRPAGDAGTYYQTVPFWVVAVAPQSRLVIGSRSFSSPGDVLQINPTTVRTF